MYSGYIGKLIEELEKLPGIGNKSAERLAFHIIGMPGERVERLAGALTEAKAHIRYCSKCCTLTDREVCPVCSDHNFFSLKRQYFSRRNVLLRFDRHDIALTVIVRTYSHNTVCLQLILRFFLKGDNRKERDLHRLRCL